ncbi:hypothetical protein NL676_033204 [Syzygium grande]|nr:hypothetical protein NL676_033204 [Syzygium grande]
MIKIPKTHRGPSISSRPSGTLSRVRIPPSTKSPEQTRASKMGASSPPNAEDPLAGNYGEVPLPELQSKQEEAVGEPYTEVDALAEGMKGRSVCWGGEGAGAAAAAVAAAAAAALVLVRGKGYSLYKVRCVVTEREGSVSRQMVEFAASSTPGKPLPSLPFNLEDEAEIERAPQAGEQLLRFRNLNFVALDPRTPHRTESIVIQSPVETIFWRFLFSEGFLQITTPKFTEGGVQMLKDAGIEIDYLDHLNVEVERKLGQLVLEKYGTKFYILHRYPLAIRPFNTMPCYDDPAYSNSFNVFLIGGQIISGAQRVHDCELLAKRAEACGTKVRPAKYTSSLLGRVHLHTGASERHWSW